MKTTVNALNQVNRVLNDVLPYLQNDLSFAVYLEKAVTKINSTLDPYIKRALANPRIAAYEKAVKEALLLPPKEKDAAFAALSKEHTDGKAASVEILSKEIEIDFDAMPISLCPKQIVRGGAYSIATLAKLLVDMGMVR